MDKRILATIAFVLFLAIPLTSGTAFAWGTYSFNLTTTFAGAEQTNYPMNWSIDTATEITAGRMNADCSDVRFYYINGSVTNRILLNAWNESCSQTAGINSTFWTNVSVIRNSTNEVVRMTFGNASLSSYFNGNNTFEVFSDFEAGYANGSALAGQAGFTAAVSATNWEIADAGAWQGTRGIYAKAVGDSTGVKHNFTTTFRNMFINVKGRQNGANAEELRLYDSQTPDVGTGTNLISALVFWGTTSQIRYRDAALGLVDMQAFSTNTWYNWRIIVNESNMYFFVDNSSQAQATGFSYGNVQTITFGSSGVTTDMWDLLIIGKHIYPEPTYIVSPLGTEPSAPQMSITVNQPTNTTYHGNNTISSSFFALSNDTLFNVTAYIDGTLIYQNSAYQSNTTINLTLNTTQGRQYNFTVNASQPSEDASTEVFFYIFKGLNISVFDPAGNAITGWNLTTANSTDQINLTGFNNGQSFEWLNLTGGSSTITIGASGYDTRTLNLTISNSMNYTQHNFTLYRLNYFQAISTFSNATITPLRLNFTNTSFYLQVNGTTSPVIISSRNLFLGANTITGFVSGYSAQSVAFTFNTTNFANITFNLSPVAFQMRVLDEDIRNVLTAWDATFVNIDNNNTELDIAFNNSLPGACRDGSISTICRSVGQANVSNVGIIGIGLNSVTFLVGFQCPSGGDNVILQIRDINGNNATIFDSDPDAGGCNGAIQSSTVVVNNINGSYPRFINVTMVSTSAANITEFDLTDASPYTYAADNQSATILFENFTSSTLNLFIQGAEGMNDGAGLYTDTAARMYRLTQLPPSTNFSFTGYLLKDEGINYLQAWTIQNLLEQPLSDALITLSRFYPSGSTSVETTVAQCISNPAGSCTIFLKPNQIYSFRVALTGYNTLYNQSVTFTTTPNPALIILRQSGAGNITTIRDGITFELDYPDIYNTAAPINVSCTVSNSHGSTNYVEFNITRYLINGTSAFYARSFSNSAPTGIGFTIQLNDTGRYALLCTHQWTANTTVTAPQVYTNNLRQELWIATDSLHNVGLDLFGAGDAENPNILIITSFILLITAILIVNFAGFGAGGIIVLIVAGILVWLGLLSLLIFLALILTFMAIYILRGGL